MLLSALRLAPALAHMTVHVLLVLGDLGWLLDTDYELIGNLMKSHFDLILILMVHSGHKFMHVMIAELLDHVRNYDLIWSLFFV